MTDFMTAIDQFHFMRPWWLLAVVPATVLVVLLWKRQASYGNWDKVISPHLLPHLMKGGQVRQSRAPLVLLLIGWLVASIAMAGPTWRKLPQPVQKKVDAQVIVLDLSLSMYATDLAPSRLLRARMKLTDILQRTHEGLTALVVFAGTPHVVTPLTDDTNTILSMVSSLSPDIMPIKGSDPIAAIKKALEVFKQGGISEGRILLMTDGVPANFATLLAPVVRSATPVSIMGIGTVDGAPIALPDGTFVKSSDGQIVVPRLAIDALKQAARRLGGRFSTLTATDDDINYLLDDTRVLGGNEMKETRREFDLWDEAGPWVVALFLLPLAAMGYRRGWLSAFWMPALLLITLAQPRPAVAFEWSDLWETPDQQGQQLLGEGNPKAAAEKFEDKGWQGTSHFRAGDYEAAANAFAQQPGADGHYNQGNALAHQQKFDDAISAYEEALKLNPELTDARANLKLVKKLKEQQQQQQQQNNDQNSDQKNKDQQNDPNQQQQDHDQQQQQQDSQQQQDQQQNQDQQQDQQNQQQDQDSTQQEQEQQRQQNQDQKDQQQKEQPSQPEQEQPNQDDDHPKPLPAKPEGEQSEDQQALEQWLRRIPDDPGGLLRRKFQRETQLRKEPSHGDSTW